MTATTTDPQVLANDVERALTFASTLRDVADAIAAGAMPPPRNPLRVYVGSYTDDDPKATFLAARRAFPNAPVEVDPDGYGYIEIVLGSAARLLFDKKLLGTTTTVTRPVEEFVVDAALLAAPCTSCGRILHDDDPSNTGRGHHVDCTVDGALAGQSV